jgi:hypothetical protein
VVVSHGRCSSSRDPCGEHLNSFKKVTERERANNIMDATCPCALLLGHFPLRLTHPSRMRSLGIYFIVLPTRWIKYAALSLLCVCAWEESLENAFDTRTHTRTPLGLFRAVRRGLFFFSSSLACINYYGQKWRSHC